MKAFINEKEENIKTVSLNAKCSDLCFMSLKNDTGATLIGHGGYVPGFFPGKHGGDYIELEIDMDTGKILNWNPTTDKINEDIGKWELEEDQQD
jgi:hypothetical protein